MLIAQLGAAERGAEDMSRKLEGKVAVVTVARWIWRCLLREDQEQQGKHYKTSDDEGQ